MENWVGTELVREASLTGGRLILRTPELPVGGLMRVTELVWKRVRDARPAPG